MNWNEIRVLPAHFSDEETSWAYPISLESGELEDLDWLSEPDGSIGARESPSDDTAGFFGSWNCSDYRISGEVMVEQRV